MTCFRVVWVIRGRWLKGAWVGWRVPFTSTAEKKASKNESDGKGDSFLRSFIPPHTKTIVPARDEETT